MLVGLAGKAFERLPHPVQPRLAVAFEHRRIPLAQHLRDEVIGDPARLRVSRQPFLAVVRYGLVESEPTEQ